MMNKPALIALLLLLTASSNAAEPPPGKVIAQENSVYHTIYVTDEADGLRCMRFSLVLPGRQSCVDPKDPQRVALDYGHAMLGALFLQPAPTRILMIGLGGGSLATALRQLYPDAVIDAVEIDPAVAKVAEQYFYFKPDAKQQVIVGDGRNIVRRAGLNKKTYDIVLLDAFDKRYVPEHMLTLEFIAEMKAILAPGGVVAANTASGGALYAYESQAYAQVFGLFYNLKPEGRIILAARDGLPPEAMVKANAARLAEKLKPLGIVPDKLLPLFVSKPDWPADTPVLIDKYAPADLLNRQPALTPDKTEKKP